ncbi:ferredoxin [Aeromicrobium stalagmiti]|uniref:ferredoxin n=1 Tax=Aeromicrobium stalagmiti TaxID=2738988 RepID=UPI001568D70E|nr:ferredoxin [Aeromicrobium stalagmiti]NRQ51222.1 ferredoxin [Aeromicrobium stalagmiti]
MTTIDVDWTRCDAHGLCSRLLPEKVSLDEWGFPVVDGREVEPGLVKAARQAALACPALALRVQSS